MDERRRKAARTFLGLAGASALGVYLERFAKWTDEQHAARLSLTREGGEWRVVVQLRGATFESTHASLVVAFSMVAPKVFAD